MVLPWEEFLLDLCNGGGWVSVVWNKHAVYTTHVCHAVLQCSVSVSELTRQASSPVLHDLFCILSYTNIL